MNKISTLLAALLLVSVSVAHAETAPASQGAESVNKNLAKNPDNKGLQNASEHIKENQERQAAKREQQEEKRDEAKEKHEGHEKHERMEKHEHHDKMEHPAKPERPGR